MPNVTLFRADVPIDSAGNVASRDFYRWLSDMTARVGGTTGSLPDASETFDDAGIEEIKSLFYRFSNDVGQTPVVQELMYQNQMLTDMVSQLSATVAELARHINGMEQETLQ